MSIEKRPKRSRPRPTDPIDRPPIEETDYYYPLPNSTEVRFFGIRAGSEFGDPRRGGTWYVIKVYEGQSVGYQESPLHPHKPYGVGGKDVWEKPIRLKNPYYVDVTEAETEGYFTLVAVSQTLGKDEAEDYKERLEREEYTEFDEYEEPEKIYAEAEKQMSEHLKARGYDGIIFYHRIGVHTIASEVFVFLEES
jgi:hypothetical protein